MKKILLSAILCSTLFASNSIAQLPDGSIAPDFTTVDINGNTHNLYDYLDQGYTVVMDISATWCPPCWSYHQGGALEDLWVNHGPAGAPGVSANTTDDVVVLWFEGDASTTQADLEGTGSNTQGDWITGTLFPICDDDNIAQLYQLPYWPIIYTICPNRIINESGQLSATAHYSGAAACPSASGDVNGALLGYTGETVSCGTPVAMSVDLQNMGNQALTSATIEVMDGGTSVLSYNWTGNLATYEMENVAIGTVTPTSTTTYTIEITSADDDASNNSLSQTIGTAEETNSSITVEFLTDDYADESYMELTNSNGDVIWSEGNENVAGNFNTGQFPPPADPTNALTNNKDGFTALLAVVAPNLMTKPATCMFNKVTIKGAKQAVQMFGPAQHGVAKAVMDCVAEGTIPEAEADNLFISVGVFIHWLAEDDKKIQEYNYTATKEAIERAVSGEPKTSEVVSQKDSAEHPFAAK